MNKIKHLLFLVLLTAASAWSDDMVMSSNFTPFALAAKQIAPGVSRVISAEVAILSCDSCKMDGVRENVDGKSLRFDFSLIGFTWPKTANRQGAENFKGNQYGGGVYLNVHYAFPMEAGFGAVAVQWAGPFYVGASYDVAAGLYYGEDEESSLDVSLHTDRITGNLNVGGGAMVFMNNHGLGFGMHSGFRQIQVIRANYKEDIGYDEREVVERDGFEATDWRFYYGLDFAGYSNLPLLKETKTKGHAGYHLSIESGFRLKRKPLMYWAIQWSFLL